MSSKTEPKNSHESSKEENYIYAMNKELDQIEKNKTWELTLRLAGNNVISTKWVLKRNMNQHGQLLETNPK